jgi:hypothetical protein
MALDVAQRSEEILSQIMKNPHLKKIIDNSVQMPLIYRDSNEIRLIILGQDLPVKNIESRKRVRTVLNLDQGSVLQTYLEKICQEMGINLDKNIYATN